MADEESLGDFLDFLDAASDGEVEVIAWTRGHTHKLLVLSTIGIKQEILEEYETTVIRPPGQLQESMDSHANDWVVPSTYKDAAIALGAMRQHMWDDIEAIPDPEPVAKPVKHSRKATEAQESAWGPETGAGSGVVRRRSARERVEAPMTPAKMTVLQAFGIPDGGLKDEDGNVLQLGTLIAPEATTE